MAASNTLAPPEVRETMDAAMARAWTQPLLDAGAFAHFTAVRLSNKAFTPEAAECVAELLAACENITVADLSDVIAGQLEEEALAVMRSITRALGARQLVELNVSDNALGEPGALACESVLRGQAALQRLFICNTGMSAEGAAVCAEMLTAGGPTQLRTFHYFNNMSGDGGGTALAAVVSASPLLEDLRFSATRCGRAGSAAIATAVGSCPSMAAIDFMDNTLGAEGGAALAAQLGGLALLRVLNLRDCALEDDGATAVCEALAGAAPQLEALDLSGNELTAESMGAVAAALAGKGQMRRLAVEENEIRSQGAAALAAALSHCPLLTSLLAGQNEIKVNGAVLLATAAARAEGLETLGLDENQLDEAGVAAVRAALAAAGKEDALGEVEELDADELDEDVEDVEAPADALADQLEGLSVS